MHFLRGAFNSFSWETAALSSGQWLLWDNSMHGIQILELVPGQPGQRKSVQERGELAIVICNFQQTGFKEAPLGPFHSAVELPYQNLLLFMYVFVYLWFLLLLLLLICLFLSQAKGWGGLAPIQCLRG